MPLGCLPRSISTPSVCPVAAVRRRDTRIAKPSAATVLQQGDVLVLLGAPANLAAADMRLMQGD